METGSLLQRGGRRSITSSMQVSYKNARAINNREEEHFARPRAKHCCAKLLIKLNMLECRCRYIVCHG